jgi:CelD/BcsL family acetyltransferase involved in cellulose biosynthesis
MISICVVAYFDNDASAWPALDSDELVSMFLSPSWIENRGNGSLTLLASLGITYGSWQFNVSPLHAISPSQFVAAFLHAQIEILLE